MRRALITVLLASGLAVTPSMAFAGGATGILNATFPEQIIQEMTATSSLARQAQEVRNQIQMLVYQVRNLKSLPDSYWPQAMNDLTRLTDIVSQANGLSYAMQNVDSRFQSEYPQYSPSENYASKYQQWNQTTSNSIAAALQDQHLAAQKFATRQAALQQIENASHSATGRMQVLQAGNQIAGIEAAQLQQLEQTQMANSDAQLAYMKQKQAVQSQAYAAEKQAYKSWMKPPATPFKHSGFGGQGQFSNP